MFNRKIDRFFSLAAVEGVLALLWLLVLPAAGSKPFLFGLSRVRLGLAGLTLAGIFLFVLLAILLPNFNRLKDRLQGFWVRFTQPDNLQPLLISLAMTVLVGLLLVLWRITQTKSALAFYDAWLGSNFGLFNSLVFQALPLIAWGACLALQALGWLVVKNASILRDPACWGWQMIGGTLLAWIAGLLTLFHWLSLVFSLTAFTGIPGWHWKLNTKPLSARYLLFLFLGGAVFWLLSWLLKKHRVTWQSLVLLCLLGYSLQVGMGVVDGKGIESLREKYYSTLHRSYTNKAVARNESVLESIRRYEEIYSNMLFPSTKPPGVMAIYIGMERTINGITHKTGSSSRFEQLSGFISIAFPLLSLVSVIAISLYLRRFLAPGGAETAAWLGPLWFILASNIVLFPLFLDQAFYPWFFLLSTLPILLAFTRRSFALALLAGGCLYATIFFSFSLLPILALPVFYAAIQFWQERTKANLLRQAGLLLAAALGLVAAFAAFRLILNYDFFARYANAMSVVYNYDFYSRIGLQPGQPISLGLRISQIFSAAYLNNLDFASLVSFPIFTLFLVRGVKSVLSIFQRKAMPGEALQGALFLTYLALNGIGQMSGESGRLWMYWVPVVVSLAALEMAQLIKRRPALVYLVTATQLITLLLTYQFQDLIF